MRIARRFLLAVSLAGAFWVAAAPSHAQDRGWTGGRMDTNVFYLGGGVAYSRLQDEFCDDASRAGLTSCGRDDTAWKAIVGYQITPHFAVEGGYTDFGKYSASGTPGSVNFDATAWELLGLLSWPLGERFSVYGKAGFYFWEAKANVSAGATRVGLSDDGTSWTVGLGLAYDLTRNVTARAEWQRYSQDFDLFGLSVLYKFR